MNWQPIKTAPLDRTILTDCGTAKYFGNSWGIEDGWYLMQIGEQFPPCCADGGYSISSCNPKWWMPIPALPR